ncbi:MAG: hypothetical protein ACOCTH_01820 [Halodesulfurarchaeum sp.]
MDRATTLFGDPEAHEGLVWTGDAPFGPLAVSQFMSIDITLAGSEYEWTKALWDGRVSPEGVNLTTVDFKPHPRRFTRMINGFEFDACELSMGSYLATLASDEEYPFTALPIFPWRRFRHSYMYKRTGAGIDEVADLEGRDVGIVNWQTTTGVWQRGIAFYQIDGE